MRKYLSIVLSIFMVVCCLVPYTALASDNNDDIIISKTEFEKLEHTYAEYIETRATGLIVNINLGIAKSGSYLVISGSTTGTSSVVKCGFTKVTIQQRKSSNDSWSNYKSYNDLYADSNAYTLGKTVSVPSGYQYRVTATHYAKQSLFSTQKIDSTTGYLTF